MIIVPELETVVILVPRTGSGSVYRAVLNTYPRAIMLYRHMEADGVPQGYDRWPKIGVVRDPVDRLWSLHKFIANMSDKHEAAYGAEQRRQGRLDFEDWLLNNEVPFTSPYDSAGLGRFWPRNTVRHPMPENQKSQYIHLRPDLGTVIYRFDRLQEFLNRLCVPWMRENSTDLRPTPRLSKIAREYVERVFAWDLTMTRANDNLKEVAS